MLKIFTIILCVITICSCKNQGGKTEVKKLHSHSAAATAGHHDEAASDEECESKAEHSHDLKLSEDHDGNGSKKTTPEYHDNESEHSDDSEHHDSDADHDKKNEQSDVTKKKCADLKKTDTNDKKNTKNNNSTQPNE